MPILHTEPFIILDHMHGPLMTTDETTMIRSRRTHGGLIHDLSSLVVTVKWYNISWRLAWNKPFTYSQGWPSIWLGLAFAPAIIAIQWLQSHLLMITMTMLPLWKQGNWTRTRTQHVPSFDHLLNLAQPVFFLFVLATIPIGWLVWTVKDMWWQLLVNHIVWRWGVFSKCDLLHPCTWNWIARIPPCMTVVWCSTICFSCTKQNNVSRVKHNCSKWYMDPNVYLCGPHIWTSWWISESLHSTTSWAYWRHRNVMILYPRHLEAKLQPIRLSDGVTA